MSRCFPYAGVVAKKKGTPGAISTEPIELQKERLRNHDTEKRNHNKRKESEETSHKCEDVVHRTIRLVSKSSQTRKFGSGDTPDGKREFSCMMRISKLKEDSCESVMSEEHGQPVNPSSILSLSNVSKIEQSKAASQPLVEKRGSVIRIRLKSRKQPVPETLSAVLPAILVSSYLPDSCRNEGHCEVASTSGQRSLEPVAGVSYSEGLSLGPEFQYESPLDQWVPSPFNFQGNASDDLDWILGSKRLGEKYSKRLTSVDEGRLTNYSCSTFSWPPRASYLPEVEIYALPFTNIL